MNPKMRLFAHQLMDYEPIELKAPEGMTVADSVTVEVESEFGTQKFRLTHGRRGGLEISVGNTFLALEPRSGNVVELITEPKQ